MFWAGRANRYRATGLAILGLLAASLTIAHDSYASPPSTPVTAACKGGVSNSLGVSGDVINPQSLDLQKLRALKPSTAVQDYFAEGSLAKRGEFEGVLLWDLLNDIGIKTDPAIKNGRDQKYVVVTGTDCYQAVFAMGELDPALGGAGQTIVAYAQWVNGHATSLGDDGFARLIVPGDKTGARRVRNIAQIQVVSVPPPAP
jgi:DMSO/TMAO reductase YedYZ molybdopterin-dependent catalytic subunit